ncbi:MAG: AMP-binding protein, partial [Sphaerochaetaceae bacterium]|nr:AMP-binding protein [Sphaerochaetaceae bacterium]
MKLGFTTRGWGSESWDSLMEMASRMEFSGIEPYWKEGSVILENSSMLGNVARRLSAKGLQVPAIDSALDISLPDFSFDTLKAMGDLATKLHCSNIVVVAKEGSEETAQENLTKALIFAEEKGLCLLIKTCGIYADTKKLRLLLDDFASDNIGCLWDVHHPVRDFNETPNDTITNLGAYVKHVHLRDSEQDDEYRLMGEGTLPMDQIMKAIFSINYDGVLSLEWKPEWMEDLQDREVIYPHFVNYMKRFESKKKKHKRLYPNFDGTGQYVFKSGELINLTFPQLMDRMAEEFPDQMCFKYTTLDYSRTYSEFRDDVNKFARALVSMGVRPGHKVAIWATNVPAWYITFWATVKIGAVLVTVNSAYKIHEAEYLFRQSDTHTLVMIQSCLDSNYEEIINELCPELKTTKPGSSLHSKRLPFLRNVITAGFSMKGCLTLEQAMARYPLVPQEEVDMMASKIKVDDVCNIQYTSGTTGFPKGVMLTHYNVVNNGKFIGDRMGLSTADKMMIQVPMFHCFGMVLSMTSSFTHGTTMCPLPYFSAKSSLACINQERITCFNGVPTMFIAMFNHPDFKKTNFSYMRTGIMAGSGCPADLMKRASLPNEMNMRGIISVYGQTESSPGSTMGDWENDTLDERCETVGRAFLNVECKVI